MPGEGRTECEIDLAAVSLKGCRQHSWLDLDRERLAPIGGLMPDPSRLPPGCVFHPRCPYAEEVCRRRTPASTVVGERRVMCLMYEGVMENTMRRTHG